MPRPTCPMDAVFSRSRCRSVSLLLGLLMLLVSPLAAQDQDTETVQPRKRYTFKSNHDRNGIGKFYMGREIARVMGHPAIPWLERPEREQEEKLSLLIESLDLKPGMKVADIGAGSGVISLMIAERVGPEGTVFAVDIQPQMLQAIAVKCRRLGIENVELVRGTDKRTRLEEESVDLAIMVDVYHEFAFPYEMLLDISQAIKPGGRVVFVEYRKEDRTVPIKEVHKMSQAQVKKEAGLPEFNLKWLETIDKLPWQHVIVFEKQ
jgi:precorrin-6B methylase 2